MKPRQIVVATHGHCFDGMASAAVFARLARHVHRGAALEMRYLSCGYGPNMSQIPEGWLAGDENAILDFRYTATSRLTWYFDHHKTAFSGEEERASALSGAGASPGAPPHVFHDAEYGSCTRLIADTAARDFGMATEDLSSLVRWAELIDTAGFASAADAIRRDEPVLQLASVVEQHGDRAFLERVVPWLTERRIEDVARDPWVQDLWAPIAKAQAALVERVRSRSAVTGRVVVTDLSDALLETPAKFVSYALFPECVYSVTLSRSARHYKLAVGYNPWCGAARTHDIASICKRYGGGGHAVVGAATFRIADEAAARTALGDVARELSA
ncbi:MAG: hypothetical protein R3B70_40850 [Polyangiaceae bacterium]